MKDVTKRASQVAKFDIPVLLLGETGTGKELYAKAIHKDSTRSDKPFEAINCGAIPENLIETTLFGWSKGAFTNSVGEGKGIFLKCKGGTLFLDEIGELSLSLQVKLLRVLQENQIMRVGDNKTFKTDVRIIAATNRDLPEMIMENTFREDLFHRIAIGIIEIPALRYRGGTDIMKIAESVLTKTNKDFSEPVSVKNMNIENSYIEKTFSVSAINEIKKSMWPGNVRELKNAIVRACLWGQNDKINAEDIRGAIIKFKKEKNNDIEIPEDGLDLKKALFDIEKRYIELALSKTKSKREAAELLGAKHKTFEKRCRTHFNL